MKPAPTLEIEQQLRADGARVVAGIDEVGKGSWAGPLVVCAAIIRDDVDVSELVARDSKTLSEKKREAIFDVVAAQCSHWALGIVSAAECDKFGMSNAQRLATKRAVVDLGVPIDAVIADGKWDFVTPLGPRVVMRVKADSVSASVAAASVLAKVSRDRMMRELAVEHPHWNFAGSKGYPCPKHRDGLRTHGASEIHRTSWAFMENLGLGGSAGLFNGP
ncbi:MAG: ribonuclease HII [Actinomycetota bacterium]